MEEVIKPSPKPLRLFFFWAGIIATLAYRAVIVLNFYSPLWVKISWYIGTVGFIVYFWHRFKVEEKRADLVKDYNLVAAVNRAKYDNPKQKQAISYIIKTTLTSKSRWNSLFIFIATVIALIVGVIMDLMGI